MTDPCIEATMTDAPVWYGHLQAQAWADGFNAARTADDLSVRLDPDLYRDLLTFLSLPFDRAGRAASKQLLARMPAPSPVLPEANQ